MENQQAENQPKQRLSQISREEVDIINDIRGMDFGRVNIVIQNGVIMSKEITRVVRNGKGRKNGNRNNGGSGGGYGGEEEMY